MRQAENWTVWAKKADFQEIGKKYGIDQVTARIMRNRDIITDEEINNYLNGTMDMLSVKRRKKSGRNSCRKDRKRKENLHYR